MKLWYARGTRATRPRWMLEELGVLLSEWKRYPEAAVVLETLYYELPTHPRAPAAGRQLSIVRGKIPDVDAERLYKLGLRRAELLMADGRNSDAYETLSNLITRNTKTASVADEELVRLKMAICQYQRRRFSVAAPALKKISRGDLLPDPRRLEILPVVTYSVERKVAAGKPDYWDYATLLELAVLRSDQSRAQAALADALTNVREAFEPETTARNLRLIRETRSRRGENVDWIAAIETELSQPRG